MKTNKITDLFIGVLIGVTVYVGISSLRENFSKQQDEPLLEIHVPKSLDDLKTFIESLPDSAFKANLYIILATEYAGDSINLHSILSAYAKMQMQKLQGEKNGDTI